VALEVRAVGERLPDPVVLGLLLAVSTLLAALLLHRWRAWQARRLGLDLGAPIAADDSRLGSPTLRSARLHLVGRPDHLLRVGRALVPVEHKPSARRLRRSHTLQAGALCLLVEEVYGVRPPFAVVVLAGGQRVTVPFDRRLEREVLDALAAMRDHLRSDRPPPACWSAETCPRCGFRARCWPR
jgi:CRISPR-associated exonuclease Cas4